MKQILCSSCYHKHDGKPTCKAFIHGIPLPIITGKVDHHEPYPGDGGVLYRDAASFDEGVESGANRDSTACIKDLPSLSSSSDIKRFQGVNQISRFAEGHPDAGSPQDCGHTPGVGRANLAPGNTCAAGGGTAGGEMAEGGATLEVSQDPFSSKAGHSPEGQEWLNNMAYSMSEKLEPMGRINFRPTFNRDLYISMSKQFFGKVIAPDEMTKCCGFFPNEIPELFETGSCFVDIDGPDGDLRMEFFMNTGLVKMDRSFVTMEGKKYCNNNEFIIKDKSLRGSGAGTRTFAGQVKYLKSHGFSGIKTTAARGSSYSPDPMNGYNTWPRLGYDGPAIDDILMAEYRSIPSVMASFAEAYRITGKSMEGPLPDKIMASDLMKTPEGRAWWREHGSTRKMKFDLSDDSLSMRVLRSYLEETGRASEVARYRSVERFAEGHPDAGTPSDCGHIPGVGRANLAPGNTCAAGSGSSSGQAQQADPRYRVNPFDRKVRPTAFSLAGNAWLNRFGKSKRVPKFPGIELFAGGKEDYVKASESSFGMIVPPDEVARCCGLFTDRIPEFADMEIFMEARGDAWPGFLVNAENENIQMSRNTFEDKGKRIMSNNEFKIKNTDLHKKKIGLRSFAGEVRYLKSHGFHHIETLAFRDEGYNGYFTWPRLGYDGNIVEDWMIGRPEYEDLFNQLGVDVDTVGYYPVSELMKTPEGRKWWSENGWTFAGRFDLASDSRSTRVLEDYLKETGYYDEVARFSRSAAVEG
jgi:hypothetical protein